MPATRSRTTSAEVASEVSKDSLKKAQALPEKKIEESEEVVKEAGADSSVESTDSAKNGAESQKNKDGEKEEVKAAENGDMERLNTVLRDLKRKKGVLNEILTNELNLRDNLMHEKESKKNFIAEILTILKERQKCCTDSKPHDAFWLVEFEKQALALQASNTSRNDADLIKIKCLLETNEREFLQKEAHFSKVLEDSKQSNDLEVQLKQLSSKNTNISQLQLEIKNLRLENEQLTELLVSTKERVAGDGQEIVHENAEVNGKVQDEATMTLLEKKERLLKEKEVEELQFLNSMEKQIELLNEEVENQMKKNNTEKELYKKLATAAKNAEEEKVKLQQKIAKMESETCVDISKTEVEALKKSREDLQKDHALLIEQHTQLVSSHKNKINSWTVQASDLKKQLEEVSAKNFALSKDVESLKAAKVSLEKSNLALELKVEEYSFPIKKHHLKLQVEITGEMRAELVDWLVQVHLRFHLLQETLYMAVSVLDRFLQAEKVKKSQLKLVGVTAMFIAAKSQEMRAPDISKFVHTTNNTFSQQDILQMVKVIQRNLKVLSVRALPVFFLRRNSKAGNVSATLHALAKYLMELALIEYEFAHYLPSLLAASALYLALKLLTDDKSPWTDTLKLYSTYSESDVLPVVKQLSKVVLESEKSKLQAVRKKYSSTKLFKISSIPELKSSTVMDLAGVQK